MVRKTGRLISRHYIPLPFVLGPDKDDFKTSLADDDFFMDTSGNPANVDWFPKHEIITKTEKANTWQWDCIMHSVLYALKEW